MIDVNLTAAVLTSQVVGRQMIAQQYGKIVNIGSIAGARCALFRLNRMLWPTNAPRRPLRQTTKSLASRTGPLTM